MATIRWHIGNMEQESERARAERNLREVLGYVESAVCRRKQLLAHFDEDHHGSCDACDVCLGEVRIEDATVPAQKFLSAVVRTGERFGAHHLIDVLLGKATDRVHELGHHHLPTFGVGADRDRSWWLGFSRELERGGYLERQRIEGSSRPGGFRLTAPGRQVLSGKMSVVSSTQREHPSTGSRRSGRSGRGGARGDGETRGGAEDRTPLREDQQKLFDCLRVMRTRLARERSVPPYVIFSDRTLKVIARNRPTDRSGLLRCHGIGEAKLDQYGEAVLHVVREATATGGCVEMDP